MINSMTAYANHSTETEQGTITWEIRTVNHRFLDMGVHVPDIFRELEMSVRDCVKRYLRRGKVDIVLKHQLHATGSASFGCHHDALDQLHTLSLEVTERFPQASINNVMDVLNYRGVVKSEQHSINAIKSTVLDALPVCLEQLVQVRQREGSGVQETLLQALEDIQYQVVVIEKKMPSMVRGFKKKMQDQFAVLQSQLDHARLEQECVWYAQKIDVAEELQRLMAHVLECQRIVKAGGVVGRQLDFLMQELNREANTIASKSVDIAITQAALAIKMLLEQIREQVQNIE